MSSKDLQMLCERCEGILNLVWLPHCPEYTHLTVQALEASAAIGCPSCQLLSRTIGNINQAREEPAKEWTDIFPAQESGSRPTIELEARPSKLVGRARSGRFIYKVFDYPKPGEDFQTVFDIFVPHDELTSFNNLITARDLHLDPRSDTCYVMICCWLLACVATHIECHQEPTSLPTMVLDLSQADPFLTDGQGIKAPYIILSHCWGTRPTLVTTTVTESSHRQGITKDTFPATFKDAIEITRALGVRYLWIDSLCILQDSQENWLSESSKMRQYYRDAYLTIAGLQSSDSHRGIFHTRKGVPAVQLASVPMAPDLFFRACLPDAEAVFSNSVLNSRAWALQERLLSTRMLCYSDEEIFWECNHCSMRESSTMEQINGDKRASLRLSEGGDFKRILRKLSSNENSLGIWYRLVTQYTRRALTIQSDRLPAISGIASMFSSATGYNYFAGIWKEDIQGLLWFNVDPQGHRPAYYAPSWSWASSIGAISYRFETERAITSPEDAKIIDVSIVNSSADAFGQVKGGYVKIRGISIELQCSLSNGGGYVLEARNPRKLFREATEYGQHLSSQSSATYQPVFGIPKLDYWIDSIPSNKGLHIQDTRLCILLFIQRRIPSNIAAYSGGLINPELKRNSSALHFIIIEQCKGEPNHWRRIGTASTYDGPLRDFIERGLGEWAPPSDFVII